MITATVDIHAARECARGTKQAALVEEMLVGPAPINYERIYANFTAAMYGTARLPWRSWVNLQQRLVDAGFVIEKTKNLSGLTGTVALTGRKW